jgi:hypothetical protein
LAVFHEPIRVPVFDTLRETRFGNWLVPKQVSVERHITEDERKLTVDDLEMITSIGGSCTSERFLLLSRLDRFIKRAKGKPPFFETVDLNLLRRVPVLKSFAGIVVIVMRK